MKDLSILKDLQNLKTSVDPKADTPESKEFVVYEFDDQKIAVPLEMVASFDSFIEEQSEVPDLQSILEKFSAKVI